MKIYTKTGDAGQTSLIGGTRVDKDDARIEAYGTVDELNAWVGMLREHTTAGADQKTLVEIQDRLFTIGSALATDPDREPKMALPDLNETDIEYLEQEMDRMDSELPPLRSFVLPGGHPALAQCHVARTVCRRAERRVLGLQRQAFVAPGVAKYLNRLSDYLFVLSRWFAREYAVEETPWNPRK